MKCAIVQLEAVHEEIIPSLIMAFAGAGISSEVFINQDAAAQRGDVFSAIGMSDAIVHNVPIEKRADWQALEERVREGGFEFICIATCQRESVAKWALKFNGPLIGVVHNVDMFRKVDLLMNMFKRGRLSMLTLGAHVASFACRHLPARRMDAIGVMQPVYWGDAPERDAPLPSDGTRRLAVPGGVKFETRDYLPLLDAVKELASSSAGSGIRIDVVGGGADRAELMARADEAGLGEHFHFAPLMDTKRVGYDEYVAHLRHAHFLLPLNPPRFTPYHTHKITSAVPTSIGMCLPPVIDRWTHFSYRTPGLVAEISPLSALERALACGADEYRAVAQQLRAHRAAALAANADEIRRLLR